MANSHPAACTWKGDTKKPNNKQDCQATPLFGLLTLHIYNETPPLTFFKNVSHVSRYFRGQCFVFEK